MQIRNPGIAQRYRHLRNVIRFEGVCEICDQLGTLTSCDAWVFFAPFSVPLVPLGRERIIDHCGGCGRHRAMSRRAFLDQRDADYAEVDRLLADRWLDELNALDALRLVCGYREPAVVHRVIREIQKALPRSAEAQLFVAETYRLMGNFVRAEEATRRSLELRDNDEVRESLAEFQFSRGDIDDGLATLAPIHAAGRRIPFAAVKAGVLALQRAGRHVDALALLGDACGVGDSRDEMADEVDVLRSPSERALAVGARRATSYEDVFAPELTPAGAGRRPQVAYWLTLALLPLASAIGGGMAV